MTSKQARHGLRLLAATVLATGMAGTAHAGWSEDKGATFVGQWTTTWQSPTGPYNAPLTLSGGSGAGTVTGMYPNGTTSGQVTAHYSGGVRDGWWYEGKWTRTGGGASGGSCPYGRFKLLLLNPAIVSSGAANAQVSDLTFTGKWTYCDANPSDANANLWTGNQPTNVSLDGFTLAVPLYPQLTNMWCWAASSQMVVRYLFPKIDINQGQQANWRTGRTDCTNDPTPGVVGNDVRCISGGFETFAKYGVAFQHLDQDGNWSSKPDPNDSSRSLSYVNGSGRSAMSWDQLRAHINAGQPVMFAWAWRVNPDVDGDRYISGGHMMVVRGWATANGEKLVYINNPWVPQEGAEQILTYDEWVGGLDTDHVHWRDYYDFKLAGVGSMIGAVIGQAVGAGAGAGATGGEPETESPAPMATMMLRRGSFNFARAIQVPVERTDLLAARPAATLRPLANPQAIRGEALRATTLLRSIKLTPATSRLLGLQSAEEAGSATLGQGVQEYTISPGQVGRIAGGAKLDEVLRQPSSVVFPVVVRGSIRSAVRVRSAGNAARLASFDQASVIGRVIQFAPHSDEAVSTVRMPALGLYFVTKTENGQLMLASIFDAPELGLKKGQYEPAAAVMARVAPLAAHVDGSPA